MVKAAEERREAQDLKRFKVLLEITNLIKEGHEILGATELCMKSSTLDENMTINCPTRAELQKVGKKLDDLGTYNALLQATHWRDSDMEDAVDPLFNPVVKNYLSDKDIQTGIKMFQEMIAEYKAGEESQVKAEGRKQISPEFAKKFGKREKKVGRMSIAELRDIAERRNLGDLPGGASVEDARKFVLGKLERKFEKKVARAAPQRIGQRKEEIENAPQEIQCADAMFEMAGMGMEYFTGQMRQKLAKYAPTTKEGKEAAEQVLFSKSTKTSLAEIREVGRKMGIFRKALRLPEYEVERDGKKVGMSQYNPNDVLRVCNYRPKEGDGGGEEGEEREAVDADDLFGEIDRVDAGKPVAPPGKSFIDVAIEKYVEEHPAELEKIGDLKKFEKKFGAFVHDLVMLPFAPGAKPSVGSLSELRETIALSPIARKIYRAGRAEERGRRRAAGWMKQKVSEAGHQPFGEIGKAEVRASTPEEVTEGIQRQIELEEIRRSRREERQA